MYEIIIKKLTLVTVPPTQAFEKISDTGGEDGGVKYGYVPKPAVQKEEWQVKFQQQSEEVSILDVVAAFNNVSFQPKD